MMILRRDGLLENPILYISGYLNSRRNEYIDRLYMVSSRNAIDEWLLFMAEGLRTQAMATARTVEELLNYKKELNSMAEDIKDTMVIDMLFRNPYITSKDVVDGLGISPPTAIKILKRMESVGILREVTGRERGRVYCADGIIEILR